MSRNWMDDKESVNEYLEWYLNLDDIEREEYERAMRELSEQGDTDDNS